jgi:S-adenosylmethionine:tRNA ribosyltransferase-isomerase
MRTEDFDYRLPAELVASRPDPDRDGSRLMRVDRAGGAVRHGIFRDIVGFFRPGDVLVLNNTRVFPARFRGVKDLTGAEMEGLLLEETGDGSWWAMIRPGKRFPVGTEFSVKRVDGEISGLKGEVLEKNPEGHARLGFTWHGEKLRRDDGMDIRLLLESEGIGETPLPPYIQRGWDPGEDPENYQTVYARHIGSVAAPTAGLHWTPALLEEVRSRGVETIEVTLHVGAGTFAPVKSEVVEAHHMHSEDYDIPAESAQALNRALEDGRRIIAVGTTSMRTLEGAVMTDGHRPVIPDGKGRTDIFIYPPAHFHVCNALITNFHLPQSTLLMLVSAFASPGSTSGIALTRAWYEEAISERYRFFSYGDAMLIE